MAMLNDSPKYSKKKNDYYTQKNMWKNISHLIPKDKVIYECCLLNSKSKSKEYLEELGYKVVGNTKWDCLNYAPINYDIILSNPPFELKMKTKILNHLVKLDKPFIIVLNCMNTYSKYFRTIFGDNLKHLQVIIPQGKIKFEEWDNEKNKMVKCPDPCFYCCYVAYKMNIPNEELWLK